MNFSSKYLHKADKGTTSRYERKNRQGRQAEWLLGCLMIYSTMSCGGQEEVVAAILVPVLRLLQARQRNTPGLNVV